MGSHGSTCNAGGSPCFGGRIADINANLTKNRGLFASLFSLFCETLELIPNSYEDLLARLAGDSQSW